jgi:cadmium resistance protein CadD (predicted permease)
LVFYADVRHVIAFYADVRSVIGRPGGTAVSPGVIGQAAGLFAVTNIDDILILALFFAQGAGHRNTARDILAGRYLGFAGILAVAVAAAFGATFLPEGVVLIGLGPLILIEGGVFSR